MEAKIENKSNTSLIENMFEVGAHFGYSRTRRHPSFKPLIFGAKNNVDIINLEKTGYFLNKALEFVKECARHNKTILFVGTKPEARRVIEEAAASLDLPYVFHRWIGGTLTNFSEIKKRIKRLLELREKKEKGELDVYTKKEKLVLDKEIERLSKNFSGIVSMQGLPDALFIIDPKHEATAVREARRKSVPLIGLAGSDCNTKEIDYPIPANDSALSSIRFFVEQITKAYGEGKAEMEQQKEKSEGNNQNET